MSWRHAASSVPGSKVSSMWLKRMPPPWLNGKARGYASGRGLSSERRVEVDVLAEPRDPAVADGERVRRAVGPAPAAAQLAVRVHDCEHEVVLGLADALGLDDDRL